MRTRRAEALLLGLLSLSSLYACESEKTPGDDDGELDLADAAVKDAREDVALVPLDAGPGLGDVVAPNDACPEGQLTCGAAGCVDTRTNASHCGGCDKPCESGTCTGGSCVP